MWSARVQRTRQERTVRVRSRRERIGRRWRWRRSLMTKSIRERLPLPVDDLCTRPGEPGSAAAIMPPIPSLAA